jgi:hypothetical protein
MKRHRVLVAAALVTGAVVAVSGTALAVTSHQLASASAAAPISAKLAPARSLLPGFYGVNFDYAGAASDASDPNIDSQLAALQPGTLRYPGGTGANFFQWKVGYTVEPPSGPACATKPASGTYRFTLPVLLKAYRATGAPPVFDLNVMTSTLSCQLSMLREAHKLGLPVRYVELGNELSLDIDNYPTYFPTADDYGRTVASYVKAIRHSFSGVLIDAVGSLQGSTARARTWNHDVLETARKDGGLPDAITLHVYPEDNEALKPSGLPGLFAEPYSELTTISAAITALPIARPVWITEYNLKPKHTANSNPAQTSYAEALFVAEMDLLLVGHVPSAQFIDLWSAFGPNASYVYAGSGSAPALTPGGLAQTLIDEAAHGATKTQRIVFTGAPSLGTGGSPALIGQRFTVNADNHEVLVNLSPQTLVVKTGKAIPAGASYEQVSYSGSPAAQVSTASELAISHGTTGSSVTIAPYSIVTIS